MRFLYINPDDQDRGTVLGCGWFPEVPPEFQNIATAPCVILQGAGQTTVIPDDGTLTNQQVMDEAQPLLDIENAPVEPEPSPFDGVRDQIAGATTVAKLKTVLGNLVDALDPQSD